MRTQDMITILNGLTEPKRISDDVTIYVTTQYLQNNNELSSKLLNDPFKIIHEYYNLFDTFCNDLSDRLEYMYLERGVFEIDNNDLEDAFDEIHSELDADIYTHDLSTWLNSHTDHVSYLEESVKELGNTEGFKILSGANYLWKSEMYYHFYTVAQYIMENDLEPSTDHFNYEYVGTLEDFQDSKYTLLQIDIDIEGLRQHYRLDDEFPYYLVVVGEGEYLEVYGLSGIHLSDNVYKYSFKE